MRWISSDPSIRDTFTDFYVEFDAEIPDALLDVKKPMPVDELFHKSPWSLVKELWSGSGWAH
jgi:hypothetical protein